MKKEYEHTIYNAKCLGTLLVVILHAYTTTRGILMCNNEIYIHISYILSLSFGQIAVPLFFFISGFLFFHKYSETIKCYVEKCKKRFYSLLIPYLFWNSFMIIFYYIIQNISLFDSFFSGANLEVNNYTFTNYIRAYWDSGSWNQGDSFPILQPYWYIRNLIILCLASPIIYIIIYYTKWILPIISITIWLNSSDLALSYVSIAFFSLGSTISIFKYNYLDIIIRKSKFIIISFTCLIIINYIIHFYTPYDNIPLHRIMLIMGIFFIIYFSHIIRSNIHIINKLGEASFLIYTIHLPIMIAIRKLEYHIFTNTTEITNILLYALAIVTTIYICYLLNKMLSIHFPKFTHIILGR